MRDARLVLVMAIMAVVSKAGYCEFRYFDPDVEAEIPALLSSSGLYRDLPRKILVKEAVPYDVNTPLWSDGSYKERFILLAPGTSVGFNDSGDYYAYPDKAVFVKNFYVDTLPGAPASRILWETRLMINKKKNGYDVWYGFSYKWDTDQRDARLVSEDGLDTAITGYFPGRNSGAKTAVTKKWSFPKRNQCRLCHVSIAPGAFSPLVPGGNNVRTRSVLGFFTAQLNMPVTGSVPSLNQIQALFQKGVFGSKPAPANYSLLPRWRAIEDETAPLGIRARSYIASNCSGCHGTRANLNGVVFGLSSVDNPLNYDFHDMADHMDFGNKALSREYIPGSSFLIWPGLTDKSTLWYRQTQRNTADGSFSPSATQMPPLATYEVDTVAMKVLRRWIDGMPLKTPDPTLAKPMDNVPPAAEIPSVSIRRMAASSLKNPFIRNGVLHLVSVPEGASPVSIALVSPIGLRIPLPRISEGRYAVPGNIGKGIYFVSVSGKMSASRFIRL
jgi:hypothetical protein